MSGGGAGLDAGFSASTRTRTTGPDSDVSGGDDHTRVALHDGVGHVSGHVPTTILLLKQ